MLSRKVVCFDKPCSQFGPAFGFVMKPDTKRARLPWGPWNEFQAPPSVQCLPHRTLASHRTVWGRAGLVFFWGGVDCVTLSCDMEKDPGGTVIWGHFCTSLVLRVYMVVNGIPYPLLASDLERPQARSGAGS